MLLQLRERLGALRARMSLQVIVEYERVGAVSEALGFRSALIKQERERLIDEYDGKATADDNDQIKPDQRAEHFIPPTPTG